VTTLHATLSPSAAERWLRCPASIRVIEALPASEDHDSVYAKEGTAAHALAEIMARAKILGQPKTEAQFVKKVKAWRAEYDVASDAEMEMAEHGMAYVAYLQQRLTENPGAQLLLEQKLPTGVPSSFGTSDAIIVSPTLVESVDYKYGLGVRVEAVENPQLRLYGVGALEAYGDLLGEVEKVRLTIFQPRLDHVVWEELPAADLRAWRDSIIPVAESALGPDAPFGPSDEACRWCPASGQCVAQMEYVTVRDFGVKPDIMDVNELAAALDQVPLIKAWCAAVEAYALNRVYSEGNPIPGYKVVMSGGRRSVTDPEGLVQAAVTAGYDPEDVAVMKPKGIGELEKVLKEHFDRVAAPFITKGTGSPSLVPESDKREAINPEGQAAHDFKAEDP
jgi:RecB family exonuclease